MHALMFSGFPSYSIDMSMQAGVYVLVFNDQQISNVICMHALVFRGLQTYISCT